MTDNSIDFFGVWGGAFYIFLASVQTKLVHFFFRKLDRREKQKQQNSKNEKKKKKKAWTPRLFFFLAQKQPRQEVRGEAMAGFLGRGPRPRTSFFSLRRSRWLNGGDEDEGDAPPAAVTPPASASSDPARLARAGGQAWRGFQGGRPSSSSG